jgi:hypothetical protein
MKPLLAFSYASGWPAWRKAQLSWYSREKYVENADTLSYRMFFPIQTGKENTRS